MVTLEYGNYISQFPNHEFITPKEFSERYLAGTLDKFDAVFTYSSVEHSGLGNINIAMIQFLFIFVQGDMVTPSTPGATLSPLPKPGVSPPPRQSWLSQFPLQLMDRMPFSSTVLKHMVQGCILFLLQTGNFLGLLKV